MSNSDYKIFEIFLQLAETAGFISREDSLQVKAQTNSGFRCKKILPKVMDKYGIPSEAAKFLWQLACVSPAMENPKSEDNIHINLNDLPPELQREIAFAEELLRRKLVPLQKLNLALQKLQKGEEKFSLGQVLLRQRFITPEQFFEIKMEVEESCAADATVNLALHHDSKTVYLLPLEKARYIGNYELIREIARGGMGVVYEAKNMDTQKIVALKTIIAGEAAASADIERFQREAQLAKELNHPNIVKVLDVGKDDNIHYFTMDYIEGVSLAGYIKKNRLPVRKSVKLFLQICDGLGYAHSKGIIHRDIKPGNILIDTNGKPLLTDFGLARQQDGKDGLTISGVALGTPAYMPVEQAEGKVRDIDIRSDVYSLGAVFYEVLTGRPPFSGTSLAETLQAVITKDPIPLSQLVPGLPLNIEAICMKCLEKEKKRRYPNVKALSRDLERFLKGDSIKARRPMPWERLFKWIKQNPFPSGAIGVALLVILFSAITIQGIHNQSKEKENVSKKLSKELKSLRLSLKSERQQKNELGSTVEGLKEELSSSQIYEGIYWCRKKNYEKSLEIFDKLLEQNPESSKAYYYKALTLIALQKIEMAIELLQKARSLEPEWKDVYIKLSDLYLALQRVNEAIATLSQLLAVGNQDPIVYDNRGTLYVNSNRPKEALLDFNKAISLNPNIDSFYSNRAVAFFKLGDYPRAFLDTKKALSINPRNSNAYNIRGIIFRDEKKYDYAILDLSKAIRYSNSLEYRLNRIITYMNLGQYSNALKDLLYCRDRNPGFEKEEVALLIEKCKVQLKARGKLIEKK